MSLSCKTIVGPYRIDYAINYQRQYFHNYKNIYEQANMTLKNWIKDTLEISEQYAYYQYQIDSAFVFNKDSTRLYTTINIRDTINKNAKGESSNELYGAKVGGKWYFMDGAGLWIPKNWYQDSLYAPMTFSEISYVAHTNFIQNRLFKKADGTYECNDVLFGEDFTHCAIPYGQKGDFDSAVVAKHKEIHKKKFDWAEMEKDKLDAAKIPQPAEPSQKRNILKRIFIPFRPKVFGRRRENDPWK